MGDGQAAAREHTAQLDQTVFIRSQKPIQLHRRLASILFVLYVACNMTLCAVLFAPWALPRETISGLLGRWKVEEKRTKRKFSGIAACFVDTLYFWEPDHCIEVYKCERKAREILYPCK